MLGMSSGTALVGDAVGREHGDDRVRRVRGRERPGLVDGALQRRRGGRVAVRHARGERRGDRPWRRRARARWAPLASRSPAARSCRRWRHVDVVMALHAPRSKLFVVGLQAVADRSQQTTVVVVRAERRLAEARAATPRRRPPGSPRSYRTGTPRTCRCAVALRKQGPARAALRARRARRRARPPA